MFLSKHFFFRNMSMSIKKLFRLEALYLMVSYIGKQNKTYTEWHELIHHTNFLNFCKVMFLANFTSAKLIWARHLSSVIPYATIQRLTSAINAIPETLKPFYGIQ